MRKLILLLASVHCMSFSHSLMIPHSLFYSFDKDSQENQTYLAFPSILTGCAKHGKLSLEKNILKDTGKATAIKLRIPNQPLQA